MTDFCSISDLNLKIICCIVRRFSTREALDYLKENGHDMKERTFYDHKKKLMDSKNERILDAVNDSVLNHFKLMDSLELIQKKSWEAAETVDMDQKLKIFNMIVQNELLISKCHSELLSVIDRQIESYRAVEISDRLTHIGFQKFVLKNRINSLKEKLNTELSKNSLFSPEREAENAKKKESIQKEIEETRQELEKLNSRNDVS